MIKQPSCRICQRLSACSQHQLLFPPSRRPSSSAATASASQSVNGSAHTFALPNATSVSWHSVHENAPSTRVRELAHPQLNCENPARSPGVQSVAEGKDMRFTSHDAEAERPSSGGARKDVVQTSVEEHNPLSDATEKIYQVICAIRQKDTSSLPVQDVRKEAQQLVARVAARSLFRGALQDTFDRLATERCHSSQPHLPTVARYIVEQRIGDESLFLSLLRRPIVHCVRLLQRDKQTPPSRNVAALLAEIIDVWFIYFKDHDNREQVTVGRPFTADTAPDSRDQPIRSLHKARLASVRHFTSYLQRYKTLFPTQLPYHESQLGALAAVSFMCLCQLEDQEASSPEKTQYATFSTLLKQLLIGTKHDFSPIYRSILGPHSSTEEFWKLKPTWKAVHRLANTDSEVPTEALAKSRDDQSDGKALDNLHWGYVRNEIQRWDADGVRRHWKRFLEDLDVGATDPWVESRAVVGFLWRFNELSEYGDVLMVFKEAKRRTCKLGILHYNPVLDCFKAINDVDRLQATWDELQRRRIVPNNPAWCTFLEGQLKHGYWKEALELLEQMGNQWTRTADKITQLKTSFRGAPEGLYLPDIAPINVVIKGLLAQGIVQPVAEVLKFAETHALRPDRYTHNIILRHFIDRPDLDQAIQRYVGNPRTFLDSADVYTLSILTRALFKSRLFDLARRPVVDQDHAVDSFLDDLRASGVKGPPHIFTTVIHTLLSGPTPNFAGAHRVLRFMDEEQGVAGTAFLLSLFAKHHLGQGSWDHLDTLRQLWSLWTERGWAVDGFAYNQVLRGLAGVSSTESVPWDTIARARRWAAANGVGTNYETLLVLLSAMARAGRAEEAAALVDGLREGQVKANETPKRGAKEEFWELVEELQRDGFLSGVDEQLDAPHVNSPVTHDRAAEYATAGS